VRRRSVRREGDDESAFSSVVVGERSIKTHSLHIQMPSTSSLHWSTESTLESSPSTKAGRSSESTTAAESAGSHVACATRDGGGSVAGVILAVLFSV